MFTFTSVYSNTVLAQTSVRCNETKILYTTKCCTTGNDFLSTDLNALMRQAYNPETGCPFSSYSSVSCSDFQKAHKMANCCSSETYADLPGWFFDRLPNPNECLKDTSLLKGAVIQRLPEAVGKTFARNFALSTMLHANNKKFLLTQLGYLTHPKDVYKDCSKFDIENLNKAEFCWGADRENSGIDANKYMITNMNDYTQKIIYLDVLIEDCQSLGCCDANDVPKCIDLQSSFLKTLSIRTMKVYEEYLYVTGTIVKYNKFAPKYADIQVGDSTGWYPELYPWQETESYIYRFKHMSIINAKDGEHLQPEVVFKDANPATAGWGYLMHIDDDVLYAGTGLVHPSRRIMSFNLKTNEVFHYPEKKQIRMTSMVVKNGKVLYTSLNRGLFSANFTGQYNYPFGLNPEDLGYFALQKNGDYQISTVNIGAPQTERVMFGDFMFEALNTIFLYGTEWFRPRVVLSESYGEDIPQIKAFFEEVYKKVSRNVGALEMFDGDLTRRGDNGDVAFFDSQYLKAPKWATFTVDEDEIGHLIHTDGIHVQLPLTVPAACKDLTKLRQPVIAYLGGYRVTQAGEAWFSSQGNNELSTLRAGDYLTDAIRNSHSDLDSWVQKSFVDVYTAPIHSVSCASIFEMEQLGMEIPFTIGHVLSDNELSTVPQSVKQYLRRYDLPLGSENGEIGITLERLSVIYSIGGRGPVAFANSKILNSTFEFFKNTIYRVEGEYLSEKPQKGSYDSFTAIFNT